MSINSEWFLTDSFLAKRNSLVEPVPAREHFDWCICKLADSDGELTNPDYGVMPYKAGEDYIIRDPEIIIGSYRVLSKTLFDQRFIRK